MKRITGLTLTAGIGLLPALLPVAAYAQTGDAAAVAAPVNIFLPTAGYVYFNRPGADLAKHEADLDTCAGYAYEELHPEWYNPFGYTVAGLISESVNQGIHGKTVASGAASDVENCMVASGWRVVRVPDAEGAELGALSPDDLRTRLTPWIGAEAPHGILVRSWNNDAAHSLPSDSKAKPNFFLEGQLSWKIHKTEMTGPRTAPSSTRQAAKIDEKWPIKLPLRSLKLADIAKAPPGSALIILHLPGINTWNNRWLSISREGKDPTDRPSLRDHAPDFYAFIEYRNSVEWFIEAVEPGIWRISGLNGKDACLGAPAFEVKAGDVIYAGTFDLGSTNVKPDLDLAPAMTFLAGTAAADTLKPAAYVNGSRAACGLYMYAYEIPGAPFRPDYANGSRARVLTSKADGAQPAANP